MVLRIVWCCVATKDSSLIGVLPEHWVFWTSLLCSGGKALDRHIKFNNKVSLSVFYWSKKYCGFQSVLLYSKFMLYHKTSLSYKEIRIKK